MVGEKICGKCCFWFTGFCFKWRKNIDVLSLACEDFKPFSKYQYNNMEDFIE